MIRFLLFLSLLLAPVLAAAQPAQRHMVAAGHPLAVEAGLGVLRDGGSALDAAVAVQAVLTLVEPQSSGIGGGRCGIRISPVTPANDASDASPQALFEHVASFLGTLSLAYVHTIEGSTGAARDFQQGEVPFDYMALKKAYQQGGGHGAWMLNNAYDRALADQAIADGADLIAFGKSFIANPDLATRLKQNSAK